MVGRLTIPDLMAGVSGVGQDRRDASVGPDPALTVRIALGVRAGGARHVGVVQGPSDSDDAAAPTAFGEDPRHVPGGAGIGVQALQTSPPPGMRPIRMRTSVHQAVTVGRSPAQVSTLVTRLCTHGGRGPEPGPHHLPP